MKRPQFHSNFLSSPRERKKLLKQISGNYFSKKLDFGWTYFVPFLMLGLTPMMASVLFFNIPGSQIFISILAVITLIIMRLLPFSFLKRRLGLRADQREMWRNLDRYYGGLYKVLAKIRLLLEDEEIFMHTVKANNHTFHIVGDWYINIDTKDVVHISEIAAIVVGKGHETFIIFNTERVCIMMLEKHQQDDIFEMFHKLNPHILHTNDKINMPVEVKEAHKRKRYAAIIEEHNKRKSEEVVFLTDEFWERLAAMR